ncbi:MAG: beta-lactamase family protein [Clostridiales bacterium]|nr:beta-lactamase family protein [Clostridiales bacterium]
MSKLNFSKVDELIGQAIADNAFTSASVLVGRNERVLHRRAYGRISIDDAPMTNEQTRYDIASITKPLVVGMLTLRAVESGDLCLWDKLGTFIDTPKDKQNITIAQILTHTAGFTTGLHLWKMAETPEHSTELLLGAPLIAPPGTRMLYCCAGYILLGQLLECIYGESLDVLANRGVFQPLGMHKTSYCPQEGNIAATEMQDDGRCLQGIVHDENAQFLGGISGNSGVFSGMDDLALFMQMLAAYGELPSGAHYLCKQTLRLALSSQTEGMTQARGYSFYLPHMDNGYIGDLFPKETVGHTGFTGTSITLDPTSGLYLVFLSNRICPSRDSLGIYRVRRLLHNMVYAAASR